MGKNTDYQRLYKREKVENVRLFNENNRLRTAVSELKDLIKGIEENAKKTVAEGQEMGKKA